MRATRTTLVLLGAVTGLIGMILTAVGLGLVTGVARPGGDGWSRTPAYRLVTTTHAVTAGDLELHADVGVPGVTALLDGLTARVEVTPEDPSRDVFVGIAETAEVDRYLRGVSRDVVVEVSPDGPGSEVLRTDGVAGTRVPARPGEQGIWAAAVSGSGPQELVWPVEDGDWSVVVMAADATRGLAAEVAAGITAPGLRPVGVALLVFGVLAVGGALTLLLAATSGETETGPRERVVIGGGTAPGAHPVTIEGALDAPGRAWWLVKWLLLIPHYLVLAVLWTAFALLTLAAGVAILFTGRYPHRIFVFNRGVLRWTWRVAFYGYGALGTDRYPPFTLADVDHPARLDVTEPGRLSRGLVLVKWWLLALPHLLVLGVLLGTGATWSFTDGTTDGARAAGGGFITLLVLIAGVALLVTARYPQGLFDLVMGLDRWVFRVIAYVALMTDVYPPFRLDGGGSEPVPPVPPPGAGPSPEERHPRQPAQV